MFSCRPQPVGDDLLHGLLQVEVIEAIAEAHLPSEVRVRGYEPRLARVVLAQIFDDDARLGDRAIPRVIAQHGKLADGPNLEEVRAGSFIGEVDDVRLERRFVLIERDERLPAERRQRMEIELERHVSPRFRLRAMLGL